MIFLLQVAGAIILTMVGIFLILFNDGDDDDGVEGDMFQQ